MNYTSQFIADLKVLKKKLSLFIMICGRLEGRKISKKHIEKKEAYLSVLRIINLIVGEDEIIPNCSPDEIPISVSSHNRQGGGNILNSKISYIKKHKEDYEHYLLNCYGIQLGWKNGLPSPNVGRKFLFKNDNGRLIISLRQQEKNNQIGQPQLSELLSRYRKLEHKIRSTKIEENASASLTEESDLELLETLEALLKERTGGLNDIYDNIIRDPAIKAHYEKVMERIRKDWDEDGRMTDLKKRVIKKLEQNLEREQDSPCIEDEPEPKSGGQTVLTESDLSNLPLFNQGTGDCSLADMNDIDQGATGDCYYLSSIAAVAKNHPELFEGPNGIIQKKGENYEVTLMLRKDRNSEERTPTIITVSPNVLVDSNGNPEYQGLGDNELWAIVMEKAYAQALGGYDNIEGGSPKEALAVITGKKAKTIDPSYFNDEQLLEILKEALDKNSPTVFNSKGQNETEIDVPLGNRVQTLFQGHAYTLDKIQNDTIFLYNPHGQNHLEINPSVVRLYFQSIQLVTF